MNKRRRKKAMKKADARDEIALTVLAGDTAKKKAPRLTRGEERSIERKK